MIEARIFIDSLDNAKAVLEARNAVYKGQYEIIDEVFRSIDSAMSLLDEFLRLRVIPQNIWDEKSVILAVKRTKLQSVGKNSDIPLKLQFDHKAEAESYYAKHLSARYVKDFSFSRVGWQYMVGDDAVDLEIIEDLYPSIEFKSHTAAGLEALLSAFSVSPADVITGPSVATVQKLITKPWTTLG